VCACIQTFVLHAQSLFKMDFSSTHSHFDRDQSLLFPVLPIVNATIVIAEPFPCTSAKFCDVGTMGLVVI